MEDSDENSHGVIPTASVAASCVSPTPEMSVRGESLFACREGRAAHYLRDEKDIWWKEGFTTNKDF